MDTVDPPFDGIPTEGEKDHKPRLRWAFQMPAATFDKHLSITRANMGGKATAMKK